MKLDVAIVDLKSDQKMKKKLALGGLETVVDPRQEWEQVFTDAWRIMRDYFYDPNMHGVDWKKMHDRYAALLPHVAHRGDLDYILGELIGELRSAIPETLPWSVNLDTPPVVAQDCTRTLPPSPTSPGEGDEPWPTIRALRPR